MVLHQPGLSLFKLRVRLWPASDVSHGADWRDIDITVVT